MKKYKASQLVKIEQKDGTVKYGLPNHIPMEGWLDYKVVPTEEVDEAG